MNTHAKCHNLRIPFLKSQGSYVPCLGLNICRDHLIHEHDVGRSGCVQ